MAERRPADASVLEVAQSGLIDPVLADGKLAGSRMLPDGMPHWLGRPPWPTLLA